MQRQTKQKRRLPHRLEAKLRNCPKAGGGVHKWIFISALELAKYTDQNTAFDLIRSYSESCERAVPDREIREAISTASSTAPLSKRKQTTKSPNWPSKNEEQIEAITEDGEGLAELWESSPIRFDDDVPHTEEVIDMLFPDNPLLCTGSSPYEFGTKAREEWRGELGKRELIVPSPMSKRVGLTTTGTESEHTLDNTGPRKFLVIEFDKGTFEEHAAILIHLAKQAPLVMAVMSGNKSLHGWFYVGRSPEKLQLRFMGYAVSLGADPHLWGKSQFARIPDGFRVGKGKLQSVIYLNTTNLGR
jgi:hypothetical protein